MAVNHRHSLKCSPPHNKSFVQPHSGDEIDFSLLQGLVKGNDNKASSANALYTYLKSK